jgi:hypothetical protein
MLGGLRLELEPVLRWETKREVATKDEVKFKMDNETSPSLRLELILKWENNAEEFKAVIGNKVRL